MLSLSLVTNSLIAFVDNDVDYCYMRAIRADLPANRTRIVRLRQSEMRSFRLLVPRIAAVFNRSGYPKHLPNTVEPRYSAAMHAKYEVMRRATTENSFRTRYFCWLDVGLFRNLTETVVADGVIDVGTTKNLGERFSMVLPPGMRNDSIAYCEVNGREATIRPDEIVAANHVWVCGCVFVGEAELMRRWTTEYRNGMREMLRRRLMSTDQQVIYFIFNALKPRTKIQTFRADGRFNEWFHLGYLMRAEGMRGASVEANRPTMLNVTTRIL